jgi:hypothetical protein
MQGIAAMKSDTGFNKDRSQQRAYRVLRIPKVCVEKCRFPERGVPLNPFIDGFSMK